MVIMAHGILRFLVLCVYLFIVGQSQTVSHFVDDDEADVREDAVIKEPFTLDEIYNFSYYNEKFNGTWISDKEIMVLDMSNNDIIIYDVMTGNKTIFIYGTQLRFNYHINSVSISADRQYVLFYYNSTQVYRHSILNSCIVYNVLFGIYFKLENGDSIVSAMWAPTGSNLAYVYKNDIYYMTLNVTNYDQKVIRLTTTGVYEKIYNGVTDWVYEEEVLSSGTAMWFSEDGERLAFATFNDTDVKNIAFMHYGEPGNLKNQYPEEVKIKYPKAGTANPTVSLSVVDLKGPVQEVIDLAAPVDVIGSDNILYNVKWWDPNHVIAIWTNRVQNQSQMMMYDERGVSKRILYNEEKKGWLQPNIPVRFQNHALLLKWEESGTDAGKFRHIVKYECIGGSLVQPVDLTPGPSEVKSILTIDRNGTVYYLATAPGKPNQQNLYSVPVDASQKSTCISCQRPTPKGPSMCTYATASFSKNGSYYALSCLSREANLVTIHNDMHREILTWNDNAKLRRQLSRRLMPHKMTFTYHVNGYNSTVKLLLPPNFNESESYPMLVNVYAGPNTAKINDNFKIGYEHYLTTNRSVIYAMIDGRGSAFKGSKMLWEIYRGMGTVEIEDTIAVTELLLKQYSFIDPQRIGIWGWSYGGFTTGMVLATDVKSVFKCGISVAPVTSWIYYDSIYTERYMGMPTVNDNLDGYYRTDITRLAEGIRGKKYLLIHGTADDNVHYQQSMALAKALEEQDILFQEMTYPDENHSLGHYAHLYHTMDKFWSECFQHAH